MRLKTLAAAVGAAAVLLTSCGQQQPGSSGNAAGEGGFPTAGVQLIAPAAPGGGWDSTARSLQASIEADDLAPEGVEVVNIAGAGGTIGLSQFVTKTDPNTLMVTGATLVGAIATNESTVTLDDVVPIARLTEEHHIVVVPANSPFQNMGDLVNAMKANVGAVSIAGGSAGGTDQITAGLIAEAAGVDPAKVNYVAFSGGGESLSALLGGQVSAGISNVQEYIGQVQAGRAAGAGRDCTGTDRGRQYPDAGGAGHQRDVRQLALSAGPPEDDRRAGHPGDGVAGQGARKPGVAGGPEEERLDGCIPDRR